MDNYARFYHSENFYFKNIPTTGVGPVHLVGHLHLEGPTPVPCFNSDWSDVIVLLLKLPNT